MTSISIFDLLTIVFVFVDDWHWLEGIQYLAGKPGVKEEFLDSEVITLMLMQEFNKES